MLLMSAAFATPLCDTLLRERVDRAAVKRLVEQGADVNQTCVWYKNVNGLQTTGGFLAAVFIPVVGVVAAANTRVNKKFSSTPFGLVMARRDQELLELCLPTANVTPNHLSIALEHNDHSLLDKLIPRASDTKVRHLTGASAYDVTELQRVLDKGIVLTDVFTVHTGRRSWTSAWITLAMANGLPFRTIEQRTRDSSVAVLEAVLDASPDTAFAIAANAVQDKRWDVYDAVVARHPNLQPPKGEKTFLMEAARNGDRAGVERLLPSHPDLMAVDRFGNTALHHAAHSGNVQLLPLLESIGIDNTAKGRTTPLSTAMFSSEFAFAKALLDKGATLDDASVQHAVRHVEALQFLLSNGLEIDHVTKAGESLTWLAVDQRRKETLSFLRKRRAPMNGETAKTSPLQRALTPLNKDWVKLVMAAGGRLDQVPEPEAVWRRSRIDAPYQAFLIDGGLPPSQRLLLTAVKDAELDQIEPLIARGVAPTSEMLKEVVRKTAKPTDLPLAQLLLKHGVQPGSLVFEATEAGRFDLVALFLEHGGDLEHQVEGETPLTWAAQQHKGWRSHREADVSTLLDLGADPDTKNADDRTPLAEAIEAGRSNAAELLLAAGAEPNCVASIMETPCTIEAFENYQYTLAQQMLEAGADPNVKDRFDRTLLDHALQAKVKNLPLIDSLIEHRAVRSSRYAKWVTSSCDLERMKETYREWPRDLPVMKWAKTGGCKAEVKALLKSLP